MSEDNHIERADGTVSDDGHLGRYASYEDDGDTVVCDRRNPKAWLRSNVTIGAEP